MVEAVHAAVGVVEVVGGRVAVERLLELRFEEEAEKLKVLVEQMRAVIRWRGQVEFTELELVEMASFFGSVKFHFNSYQFISIHFKNCVL